MKTTKLLLLATLFAMSLTTQAQVSVNVNIGTPPVWAPRDAVAVHYYYLPDIEVYYDVPAQRYIYSRNGKWFYSAALPSHYRYYDLHHGHIVYLTDYRGSHPYYYFDQHKAKYHKGNNNKQNNSNISYHDNGNNHGNGNKHDNGNKHGKGKK